MIFGHEYIILCNIVKVDVEICSIQDVSTSINVRIIIVVDFYYVWN